MQLDLFTNQTPTEPAQESYGTTLRRGMILEAKYQEDKAKSQQLQNQWLAGKTNRLTEAEARKSAGEKLNAAAPVTLVLVSCVSLKSAEANKAKDLYISDWFLKARCYAERAGDQWMILSARHGLLDPETVIEPYNQSLYGQRRAEREFWASRVASSLHQQVPAGSRIIILAGEIYREFLSPLLEGKFDVEVPMKGLQIGEQKSYLKQVNQS